MKYTKELKNITSKNTDIAGGKGASLGEMTQAGITVPPGFVILASVFDEFLKETDLNVEIDAVLDKVNIEEVHTVENASKKIQAMFLSKEMPEDIKKEVLKSFEKLDAEFVAVRSSATSEDSVSAAWAGQLETYLNTTEQTLFENIKKCWASLFTPRTIFYRFEKKLSKKIISVAVVVQNMIQAQKSGIAFSVHPVTQSESQIIIEAGLGLGEAIVSGAITPDSYVVDKSEFEIIDINVNEQTKALYKKLGGGNIWKELGEKGKKQVLSENEIVELSRLIVKIEKHYGFPVDIEWVKEKDKLYIVQSRPITTLRNKSATKMNVFDYISGQEWFFGVRADESLLFYSAKRSGYVKYLKKEYGIEFAETLLIPIKKNYPIRVFNLGQADKFHEISSNKILKNPQQLTSYITKNDLLYNKIESQGSKLALAIKSDNYSKSIELFNKILGSYEIASAQFIIIFSLGLKLAENKDKLKNIRRVIKKHDAWRNSVAFKEEALGENLFYFFEFLTKTKKINLSPIDLMKFLTLNEAKAWIDGKLLNVKIKSIIKTRRLNGFIYLNLRNVKQEIINSPAKVSKIQKHFLELAKKTIINNKNEIAGQAVSDSGTIVKGAAIVIKDKSELENKGHLINDRILVTIQTTPHYIPYIKNAKAIITDEGGITSHAAILSRELGIPTVIGTINATDIIKNDDKLEVNANKGIIKIIKK